MKPFSLLLFLVVCFFACSDENNTSNAFLNEEPYASLTDSIEQNPNNAELYYKRGALLLQNEKQEVAEKDLKKAWQLKQDEQYALGVANVLRRKNGDSAIQFLGEASKKLPESIALRIALSRGLQQKGLLDDALSMCNQILSVYPNQLDALELKTELLQAQGKDAEAVTTLEQAYRYAPSDPELAHQLAFLYAESKNPKALYLSDSLIKADVQRTHAEPYYFKGVYYVNAGNKAQALNFFNQAIQRNYNFLDAYMDKGNLLYESKKFEEALKTFELATTVSPTFADAYFWSGKTKEAMGNKKEAKLDYQRAFGLDKSMREAKEAADKL